MHRVSRSGVCAYKNLRMFCVFEQRFVSSYVCFELCLPTSMPVLMASIGLINANVCVDWDVGLRRFAVCYAGAVPM
jgi:hypothetical protein